MKHTVPAFVLLVLGLLAAGCAGVIPADLRGEVDRGLTLPALQRDPEGHRGRVALLGGELLSSGSHQGLGRVAMVVMVGEVPVFWLQAVP